MKIVVSFVAVALLGAIATTARATPAPESARRWSFEIAPAARDAVGSLDRRALLDDTFFLDNLTRVLLFGGIAGTFLQYQEHLAQQPWDVAPFLRVAEGECRTNVVRCSNALLLAVILDREASAAAVARATSPEKAGAGAG
jgi:hypothetical protein